MSRGGEKTRDVKETHRQSTSLLDTSSANARSISFFLIIVFRPTKKEPFTLERAKQDNEDKRAIEEQQKKKAEQSTKRTHSKAVFADHSSPYCLLVTTLRNDGS